MLRHAEEKRANCLARAWETKAIRAAVGRGGGAAGRGRLPFSFATTVTTKCEIVHVRGFAFPDELFYLVEHDTWARAESDGILTVGLTALGSHISGDFLEFLPKPVGTRVERERAFGMLEMSKTLRSARAPASGTIIAINEAVRSDPTLTNRAPYGAGWLIRLQPQDWGCDAARLTTGAAIEKAVLDYMRLHLVHEFSQALPPE